MNPMPSPPSTLRLLLSERLRGGLDEMVLRMRDEGVSWRQIAEHLRRETGLRLSHEILRLWYREVS